MGITAEGRSYWQAENEGVALLDTTIGDLLDRRATELPEQEAVVYSCYPEFGDALNIRWTYREYRERANEVTRGLMALGLNKGDHIAVLAANLPEWPLLMMGAARAGLVLVTINPVLQAAEVEYILKQAMCVRCSSWHVCVTMTCGGYMGYPPRNLIVYLFSYSVL